VSVEVLAMAPQAARLRRQRIRPGAVPIAGAAHTARYVARLAVRLRRLRPDLVHTNSLKAALYGGVAARLAGVPCLWHIRDRVADDYLPGAATRLVLAGARRLPAAVIANSDSTLGTLAPALAGSGIPARVIHDPYHPERNDVEFRSGALQPAGGLRVGMVGRLAPWKGQHVFMEAFARAFPNSTAEGVIIGSPLFGEDDYAEELQRKAQQLGLHERLRFAGFVDDVEGELAAMDVLVHASVIPEPFGQVVVEGMAAGLPVVAPSSGGPSEVIEHGVEGLLYPTGDVQALADSLGQLAEDPGLRDRLGAAGRRRARDFEPSAIAAEVMEVYDAMPTAKLSRRKMRRPKSGDAR
jgi:glycosyltransferase involved in cell wall biosynthesis